MATWVRARKPEYLGLRMRGDVFCSGQVVQTGILVPASSLSNWYYSGGRGEGGVKWPDHDANQSPPSRARERVKAICGSYSTAALRRIVLLPK